MAHAPQIPNLLTSRAHTPGQVRRGGFRSAGVSGEDGEEDPEAARARKDKIVQGTDTDANVSRMSAVTVGYLDDPFAREFATASTQRRFPIINRGTYVRTRAIDLLVEEFLYSSPSTRHQIISLGAGSDTRFFRLSSQPRPPNVLYHELDFPINTASKIATINSSPALRQYIGNSLFNLATDTELHAPNYHIHAVDLRTLDREWVRGRSSGGGVGAEGEGKLGHIDPALPTLLISECCLTYLAPDTADAVVRHFINVLSPAAPVALILYEPINPFDAFGKVMVSNLAARGIVLQTLQRYHSLEAQRGRMKSYGFVDGQGAVDIDFVWDVWVEAEEKKRMAGLEMLDEVEELNLLAKHYCVAWGWRDGKREEEGNGKGQGRRNGNGNGNGKNGGNGSGNGRRKGEGSGEDEGGVWDRWKELKVEHD
ncbi:hypothetical protein MMC30_002097 [Trapelia coarctata]|nr:hypothetical protein [Trapelia coarctata]